MWERGILIWMALFKSEGCKGQSDSGANTKEDGLSNIQQSIGYTPVGCSPLLGETCSGMSYILNCQLFGGV